MPDPWWRRLRRSAAAALNENRVRAKPAHGPPASAEPSQYLYRAANCFLRAGEPVEAAHCLRRLGEYQRAAVLYQDSASYEDAAVAYEESGQPETAAWVYAHQLGMPQAARDILERVRQSAGVPPTAPQENAAARANRLRSWQHQVELVRDQLNAISPGPASGSDTRAASTRHRITGLAAELIGDSGGRRDLAPYLSQVGQLKRAAIGEADWPTGYAAREFERLLVQERDARLAERQGGGSRSQLAPVHALALRLVEARCDAADGAREERILPVLTQAQALLADPGMPWMPCAETWAVTVAAVIRRYDQVSLTFAAAVRGERPGAATRWRDWSAQVLKANVAMPADAEWR